MTITINSNILSLSAQRRFGDATKSLNESFNRLSSGLRINKASDDAAGLAISSQLTADRRVTNQGIRNINDGISYLNVAESSLDELTNIITRIGELAEQSANGTLGNNQREALQSEVTSLESEYNRIIRTTSFNGNQLLTGLNTKTVLQGGYGTKGQLAVQVGNESLGIENDLERAGLTTRVDTASDGTVGNNTSNVRAISADGRFVAFNSNATNLVAGDTNNTTDAFVKNLITGVTTRVSTSSGGVQGNSFSSASAISGDGRYVAFNATATNLVAGDTNGQLDSFVKDTVTGITTRISTDSLGNQGDGASEVFAISDDGRYVAFNSTATNLVTGDTNGQKDAFVKDTITGVTTRISVDSSGNEGNNSSEVTAVSADGRYVLFQSYSTNLIAGDTNGQRDAFVKDAMTGVTTRISTDSNGSQGNNSSQAGGISADGRYVTFFSSASNLVAGDTNGQLDGFVKDLITGLTTRISTDSEGNQGNGSSFVSKISADGRYVVFNSTATNLVAVDTNGTSDSFVKDLITGSTTRISTNSIGDQEDGTSYGTAISADGRYVTYYDSDNGESFVRDLSKTGVSEISGFVVSNQTSARVSLDLSKKYLAELSNHKAAIGASLSRATTFVNTLQVQSENFAVAASQITDADIAEEAAKLTRTQIVQQAAASVLAQANQQPALALQLLKGF